MGYTERKGRGAEPSARVGLRVSPGADRSEVVGRHGEVWKVRVAARPERGQANDALLDLVAAALDVPRAAVNLVAGAASRDKVVVVEGMTSAEADRRLAARQRKGTT